MIQGFTKKLHVTLIIMLFPAIAFSNTDTTSKTKISSIKTELTQKQESTYLKLVGRWYDSQPTKEGGKRQSIMERSIDGTYKITFKTTSKEGQSEESTELGVWGASGNIYFSIYRGYQEGMEIKHADPTDPYNYDAYTIIKLSADSFEYKHATTGNKYTVKKVSSDFQFPE